MYTRKQYMAHEVTHQEYYAQFVASHVKTMVRAFLERQGWPDPAIALERDEHLNQIPINQWDILAGDVFGIYYSDRGGYNGTLNQVGIELNTKLKKAGEGFSASDMVCTLKAAVRILVNDKKKSE